MVVAHVVCVGPRVQCPVLGVGEEDKEVILSERVTEDGNTLNRAAVETEGDSGLEKAELLWKDKRRSPWGWNSSAPCLQWL